MKKRARIIFFLSLFLLVYLLCETGMFLIHRKNEHRVTQEHAQACDNAVTGLCDVFGASLQTAVQTCNNLFSQKWYIHYQNNIDYYADEFDAQSRQEIITNLQRTVTALPYISDVIMIIPDSDTVICSKGWFTLKEYAKVYGDVRITVYDTDFSVDGEEPFLLLTDPDPRRKQCRTAMMLDTDRMTKDLKSLLPRDMRWAVMQAGDRTVACVGMADDGGECYTAEYRYPALKLTMNFVPAELESGRMSLLLLSAMLLLLLIIIGMLALRRVMRPVHRLVLESGGSKGDLREPYDYVRAYIDSLKDSQNRLLSENKVREDELMRLRERAMEDFLYSLLSERYMETPVTEQLLPWLDEKQEMCLLAAIPEGDAVPDVHTADVLHAVTHELSTRIGNTVFALVWLGEDMTREERDEYRQLLRHEWSRQGHMLCIISPLLKTLSQVMEAGKVLRERLHDGMSCGSTLPAALRLELVELIQSGSPEELRQFLQQLKADYEPRDVLNIIRPVLDRPPVTFDTETDWKQVFSEAEEALILQPQTETSGDARRYVDYVDSHFADSELSVNTVADQFGRHRTLISKDIKALTGYSFSDYLRRKRIGEAISRIDRGDENITQIAADVGYISYSTFKRAFVQITGQTPMDYRISKNGQN